MTRFIHDKFAKDYLEELLKDYGEVKASEKVSGEIKEIDVLFTPAKQQSSKLQILGLLGRLAENPAIIEPYRNPASSDEICDCILKLLEPTFRTSLCSTVTSVISSRNRLNINT
jgi:hypothetical protein